MSGETDLNTILSSLSVSRRPGTFTFVSLPESAAPSINEPGIEALVREDEGVTVVVTVEEAKQRGWPVGYEAAWLTLDVYSALEAVGLTAAFATALGAEGISVNVLAAHHHDHLLVPVGDAMRAQRILADLKSRSGDAS